MSGIVREEQIGDCRLILGDCLEVLPTLGKVDAVVTDPPYAVSVAGSSYSGAINKGVRNLDFFKGDTDWAVMTETVLRAADLCISSTTERASMYWWCGHRQFGRLVDLFESEGYSTRFLVWRKECPPPSPPGSGFQSGAELCLYAYPKGRTFNGQQVNNVIDSDSFRFGQPGKVDHPTQKPLRLMLEPIHLSSVSRDTILDPFMGSGTTGVACVKLGRRFIGIEIEERYFNIACDRIRKAVAEPRLPLPEPKPKQEKMAL